MTENGSKLEITLSEQPTIEYWWEPGPGLSCLSCSSASEELKQLLFFFFFCMIFNVAVSLSMIWNNAQPTPRHRKWKLIPPPLNLESIEEEEGLSEYDCGYLDLGTGTETPTPSSSNFLQIPAHVDNWAAADLAEARRRPSRRSLSPTINNSRRGNRYSVDRDCGIWYVGIFVFLF